MVPLEGVEIYCCELIEITYMKISGGLVFLNFILLSLTGIGVNVKIYRKLRFRKGRRRIST
jgi:hypothetical protein